MTEIGPENPRNWEHGKRMLSLSNIYDHVVHSVQVDR